MNDPVIIQPIAEGEGIRWQPLVGVEAFAFLQHSVPELARTGVSEAAVSILGKGAPPNGDGRDTGLVIGYVQSGKTMSFETVTALAHDNGFQIVVVITGTSVPLFDQSTGRLRKDLQVDEATRARRWVPFQNPRPTDAVAQTIRDALNEWSDPGIPQESKRTVLLMVLKNHRRLRDLFSLLSRLDLQNVPTLFIDDEADQASLNTQVTQGTESTTYHRLMDVRGAVPNHTYLQYTATPQAPLLVNIIDSLSPNFVQVLDPGEEYVGGREFFSNDRPLARVIPARDVPTNNNALVEPPESLLEALRVFMVGVTAGLLESNNTGNRSMLVHPSHRTAQHQSFHEWVRDIVEEWKRKLSLADDDPDKQELIEDLRVAHADLARTVDNLPSFEELTPRFNQAFLNTRVLEVNTRAGQTPQVDWRITYGWIVVGGQAMDRGFTVEGLTVTYMPRGVGVGNADTVQQRARFFGYKRRYLGYCRVYVEQGTLDAFRTYVIHEEDIRAQLREFQVNGRPLNEWKRAFLLDGRLSPCRSSVVQFDYIQGSFSDDWVAPRVVFATEEIVEWNRQVVAAFLPTVEWQEAAGHADRTDVQRHLVSHNLALHHVVESLLVNTRITGTTDTQRNLGMLLQLAKALENDGDERCTVYRMSPGATRQRGVDDAGEVTNLFQGEYPVFPIERRGEVYPGDRATHENDSVTVQIHQVDLTRDGTVVATRVPVLAIWIPARLERAWLVQQPQQ